MKAKVILGIAVIVLVILYVITLNENRALRSDLSGLRDQLSQKIYIAKSQELVRNQVPPLQAIVSAIPKPSHEVEKAVGNKHSSGSEKIVGMAMVGFFTARQADDIGAVLSLDESEKAGLGDRIAALYKSDGWEELSQAERDIRFKELLTAELGEDKAALYENVMQEREAKQERDRIELVTSMFISKLGLTPEQSVGVAAAIQQVNSDIGSPSTVLQQKIRELHAKESGKDSDPAKIMKQYSEISQSIQDQRRAALNEKLKGVLSPQQYQKLISEQAASQEPLWGLRGY